MLVKYHEYHHAFCTEGVKNLLIMVWQSVCVVELKVSAAMQNLKQIVFEVS